MDEYDGPNVEMLIAMRDKRVRLGLESAAEASEQVMTSCPPMADDPFPRMKNQIPEIKASELNLDILAGAVRHHGALIVRGMANEAFARKMRFQIDRVLELCDLFFESWGVRRSKTSIPNQSMVLNSLHPAMRSPSIFLIKK
ncbi:MAG: hypothetical protein AAGI14_08455 [Pseudomonadota bacterium]